MFSLFKKKNTHPAARPSVEQRPASLPTTVRVSELRARVALPSAPSLLLTGRGCEFTSIQTVDSDKRARGAQVRQNPPQGLRPSPRSSAPGSCPRLCC